MTDQEEEEEEEDEQGDTSREEIDRRGESEEDEQEDSSREEIDRRGESKEELTSTNVVCFKLEPLHDEILTSIDFYRRKM